MQTLQVLEEAVSSNWNEKGMPLDGFTFERTTLAVWQRTDCKRRRKGSREPSEEDVSETQAGDNGGFAWDGRSRGGNKQFQYIWEVDLTGL